MSFETAKIGSAEIISIKRRPKNTTQSISIRANVGIAEIFTSILKETPSCLAFWLISD